MAASQHQLFTQYLDTDSSKERIELLVALQQSGTRLPFGTVKDLLSYDLSHSEHGLLLKLAEVPANDTFERFLTEGFFQWDQNVVSSALNVWADKTQHNYWQVATLLAQSPAISQRMSYTLLDCAWHADATAIISALAQQKNLDHMATIYYNLLLTRAIQWQVRLPQLDAIAETLCRKVMQGEGSVDTGALFPALCYHRFYGSKIPLHQVGHKLTEIWRSALCDLDRSFDDDEINQRKDTLLQLVASQKSLSACLRTWPSCQQRHSLTADDVVTLYQYLAALPQPVAHWQMFSGIASDVLLEALDRLDSKAQPSFIEVVGSLIAPSALYDWACAQTEDVQSKLPSRYTAERYNASATDAQAYFAQQPTVNLQLVEDSASRSDFFALAYQEGESSTAKGTKAGEYWHMLCAAWQNPDPAQLATLSEKARQQPRIWQLAYIDTLGRFKGCDEAVLKLLDYIRSSDQTVLGKVMEALHHIGTPRATQELIHFLTRSNVGFAAQMDIVALLRDVDLELVQKELRSALEDIVNHAAPNPECAELQEALESLLTSKGSETVAEVLEKPVAEDQAVTTERLDTVLKKQLSHYGDLPSECKRAFRTALFFDQQVSRSKHLTTIDLSPAIDMQYKALELLFRDVLEESALRLIQSGILQKKLDVIGYARPIPSAMESFENYIASLPIVADIPFFSRFKLRKMLRAICQYRKGKRFTLDGLKAFCLFMLCFGRKSCPYQMADVYHLDGFSDEQLFRFCKRLHEYQDFRNRAAHEGFHPGKSNNLEDIWAETAAIVSQLYAINTRLLTTAHPRENHGRENHSRSPGRKHNNGRRKIS